MSTPLRPHSLGVRPTELDLSFKDQRNVHSAREAKRIQSIGSGRTKNQRGRNGIKDLMSAWETRSNFSTFSSELTESTPRIGTSRRKSMPAWEATPTKGSSKEIKPFFSATRPTSRSINTSGLRKISDRGIDDCPTASSSAPSDASSAQGSEARLYFLNMHRTCESDGSHKENREPRDPSCDGRLDDSGRGSLRPSRDGRLDDSGRDSLRPSRDGRLDDSGKDSLRDTRSDMLNQRYPSDEACSSNDQDSDVLHSERSSQFNSEKASEPPVVRGGNRYSIDSRRSHSGEEAESRPSHSAPRDPPKELEHSRDLSSSANSDLRRRRDCSGGESASDCYLRQNEARQLSTGSSQWSDPPQIASLMDLSESSSGSQDETKSSKDSDPPRGLDFGYECEEQLQLKNNRRISDGLDGLQLNKKRESQDPEVQGNLRDRRSGLLNRREDRRHSTPYHTQSYSSSQLTGADHSIELHSSRERLEKHQHPLVSSSKSSRRSLSDILRKKGRESDDLRGEEERNLLASLHPMTSRSKSRKSTGGLHELRAKAGLEGESERDDGEELSSRFTRSSSSRVSADKNLRDILSRGLQQSAAQRERSRAQADPSGDVDGRVMKRVSREPSEVGVGEKMSYGSIRRSSREPSESSFGGRYQSNVGLQSLLKKGVDSSKREREKALRASRTREYADPSGNIETVLTKRNSSDSSARAEAESSAGGDEKFLAAEGSQHSRKRRVSEEGYDYGVRRKRAPAVDPDGESSVHPSQAAEPIGAKLLRSANGLVSASSSRSLFATRGNKSKRNGAKSPTRQSSAESKIRWSLGGHQEQSTRRNQECKATSTTSSTLEIDNQRDLCQSKHQRVNSSESPESPNTVPNDEDLLDILDCSDETPKSAKMHMQHHLEFEMHPQCDNEIENETMGSGLRDSRFPQSPAKRTREQKEETTGDGSIEDAQSPRGNKQRKISGGSMNSNHDTDASNNFDHTAINHPLCTSHATACQSIADAHRDGMSENNRGSKETGDHSGDTREASRRKDSETSGTKSLKANGASQFKSPSTERGVECVLIAKSGAVGTTSEKSETGAVLLLNATAEKTALTPVSSDEWDARNIFSHNVLCPPAGHKVTGVITNGYLVWCSYGDENASDRPSKRFDTIYETLDEANGRARYLFFWKNPMEMEPSVFAQTCRDIREAERRSCKAYTCLDKYRGKTWKTTVVPIDVFEWLDNASTKRHSYDREEPKRETKREATRNSMPSPSPKIRLSTISPGGTLKRRVKKPSVVDDTRSPPKSARKPSTKGTIPAASAASKTARKPSTKLVIPAAFATPSTESKAKSAANRESMPKTSFTKPAAKANRESAPKTPSFMKPVAKANRESAPKTPSFMKPAAKANRESVPKTPSPVKPAARANRESAPKTPSPMKSAAKVDSEIRRKKRELESKFSKARRLGSTFRR